MWISMGKCALPCQHQHGLGQPADQGSLARQPTEMGTESKIVWKRKEKCKSEGHPFLMNIEACPAVVTGCTPGTC